MTDGTGKPCPKCCWPMINLSSVSLRVCTGCKHNEQWHLSDGQKPLINSSRGDRMK